MQQIKENFAMNYHMFDISVHDMNNFIDKNNIIPEMVNGNIKQFLYKDNNICFWCNYNIGENTARIGLCPERCNSKFIKNVAKETISLFKIRNSLSKFFTPLYSQYNDFDTNFKEDIKLLKHTV